VKTLTGILTNLSVNHSVIQSINFPFGVHAQRYEYCCDLMFSLAGSNPLSCCAISMQNIPPKNDDFILYSINTDVTRLTSSITFSGLCFATGHAVVQLVETLRYKPEGRGFDSRLCHLNFSLT